MIQLPRTPRVAGVTLILYPRSLEQDVEVFRATSASGSYDSIARVSANQLSLAGTYFNDPLPVNGDTYWYKARHVRTGYVAGDFTIAVSASSRILSPATGGPTERPTIDFADDHQNKNIDEIDDGIEYRRTTPTEKTGAGRGYTGLNDDGRVVIGVEDIADIDGEPVPVLKLGARRGRFGFTDETGALVTGSSDSSGRTVLDFYGKSTDDFDDVDDTSSTYKKTTANEKTGAGRGYTGLDSDGRVTVGVLATADVGDTTFGYVVSGSSRAYDALVGSVPFGGGWNHEMKRNWNEADAANDGEVYFGTAQTGSFIHPNGTVFSVVGRATAATSMESSTGPTGSAYLMFVGSDKTRFTIGGLPGLLFKEFLATRYIGNTWYYDNNSGFTESFIPNDDDCIVGEIYRASTSSFGIDRVTRYALKTLTTDDERTGGGRGFAALDDSNNLNTGSFGRGYRYFGGDKPRVIVARKASENTTAPIAATLTGYGFDVTTDFSASVVACRNYDVVVIDNFVWSVQENTPFIQDLLDDGQRVLSMGNDTTTGHMPWILEVTGSDDNTYTSSFKPHPVLQGVSSFWFDSDSSRSITKLAPYVTPVLSVEETSGSMNAFTFQTPEGGVLYHDNSFSRAEGGDIDVYRINVVEWLGGGMLRQLEGSTAGKMHMDSVGIRSGSVRRDRPFSDGAYAVEASDTSGQKIGTNVGDNTSRKVNDFYGKSTDDFDDVDDTSSTYKKTTANEKTGAGRGYTGLNSDGRVVTGLEDTADLDGESVPNTKTGARRGRLGFSTETGKLVATGADSTGRTVGGMFHKTNDDFDDVDDTSSTYKKTTANEKTGAGRGYTGLNSSGRVTVGIESTADLDGESVPNTKIGARRGRFGFTTETGTLISGSSDSSGRTVTDFYGKSTDDFDDVDDTSSTYKKTTANEKTGAGRSYDRIDSDGTVWVPNSTSVNVGTRADPSTITKTIRIGFTQFIPDLSTTSWIAQTYLTPNSTGANHTFHAQVLLPPSVNIVEIAANVYRGTTSDVVTVFFQRSTPTVVTTLITVSYTSGTGWLTRTTFGSETIDPDQLYRLACTLKNNSSVGDARIESVSITYTTDNYSNTI